MRILVTGSSGFIGSHLVRRLIEEGHQVVGLDKVEDKDAPHGLVQIVGDVTSKPDCEKACSGCQVIFHLAAKVGDQGRAADYVRINAGGTATLSSAAHEAGAKRFILMSSVAVHDYDQGLRYADETTPADGSMNAYAASKLAAEQIVRHLPSDMAWTIVRPALFPFGPGDHTGFVPLAKALERGRVPLVARGRAVLSTAYVENLVDGLVATIQPQAAGQVFVIGDDEPITWKDLLTRLASALGVRPPKFSLPFGPLRLVGRTADGLVELLDHRIELPLTEYRVLLSGRDCHFVSRKARTLLGYEPRVGLDEAIAKTIAWYRTMPW